MGDDAIAVTMDAAALAVSDGNGLQLMTVSR
jgi:hypothetical protein